MDSSRLRQSVKSHDSSYQLANSNTFSHVSSSAQGPLAQGSRVSSLAYGPYPAQTMRPDSGQFAARRRPMPLDTSAPPASPLQRWQASSRLDDSRLSVRSLPSGRSLPSDPYLSSASYSVWLAGQEAKKAAEARASGSRATRRGAAGAPPVGIAAPRPPALTRAPKTEELVELLHKIDEIDIKCALSFL
jgi:hypothetical protein